MQKKLTLLTSFAALLLGLSAFSFGQKCTEVGAIKRVTKARAGNFETVTFDVNTASPDYNVENARPPFQYTGEETIKVRGNYFKAVNFKGIFWTCEITENFSAPTRTIMQVKNAEQFEGYVTYIIGYRKRSKFVNTTVSTIGDKAKVVLKFRR